MDSMARILFLTVLIYSPLALGTRGDLALGLTEILSLSALLFYSIDRYRKGKPFHEVPAIKPLIIFLFIILLQIIPLPSGLVQFLSSSTHDTYAQSYASLGTLNIMPLSVDVRETLRTFLRFSAGVVFYVLTVQLMRDGDRVKKTLMIIAITGGVIAIYALIERFFSNGKIYWFISIPNNNSHIGPYVYKNHYAGFVEMIFPLVFGLFWYYRPRFNYTGFRESLVEILTYPTANVHILLGFSALLLGTSQFVSLSRAGVVCLCLSMLFYIVMVSHGKAVNRKGIVFLFFFFLLLLSVTWFGWDQILERFGKVLSEDGIELNGRSVFWTDSLSIIRDFPVFGTGIGTFGAIYPTYRTFPGNLIVDHAHNDYVELAVTGGVVACLLIALVWVSLVRASFNRFKNRRDRYANTLFWGAVAGLSAILMHGLTDFNFYSGANTFYVFFLMGLLVAFSHTGFRSKRKSALKEVSRKRLPWVITVLVLLIAVAGRFNWGNIAGKYLVHDFTNYELYGQMPDDDLDLLIKKTESAVEADPLNAHYHLALALANDYADHDSEALKHYRYAVFLAPVNSEVLQRAGGYFLYKGDIAAADQLMAAGLRHGQQDSEYYKYYGAFLLKTGDRSKGLATLKKSMEFDQSKANINACIAIMVDSGLSGKDMINAMPERVLPRYDLADYLRKGGDAEIADTIEIQALNYLEKESNVTGWMFYRHYKRLMEKKDYQGALGIVNLGLTYLPDNAALRRQAGIIYEKLGIPYRALEEYRKSLMANANQPWIQRRIKFLEGSE